MNLGKLSAYLKILGYQPGGSGTTLPPATDTVDGYLTALDHTAFNKTRNDFVYAGDALTVTTSATPTAGTFVALGASGCNALLVTAGKVALQYQRGGAGAALDIEPNETKLILGITNASQIGFRRRDYLEAATNQVTALTAQPINTGRTFSVMQQSLVGNANATYLALTSAVCTAVHLRNTSFKNVQYIVNGAANYATLRRGQSILITGITNANQISFRPFDSQSASGLQAEVFNGNYPESSWSVPLVERLSADATIFPEDLSGVYADFPNLQLGAGIGQFSPFIKFNSRGRSLVTANYLANATMTYTVGSAGVTLADVLPTESGPNWETIGNTFSADATPLRRALRATWGANATVRITSSVGNQSGGISVADKLIFSRCKLVAGTGGALYLELHSTAPGSPTTDYHELYIGTDLEGGYSRLWNHGHRSFWANSFTAIGAGADLSSVKWARWRVAGTTGTVVQFDEIKVVEPASDRAHFYITGDDTYPSFARGVRDVLAKYAFPGVLYLSPLATTLGVNRSITGQDALRLQNSDGWQIAMQDYRGDTGTNNSIFEQQSMVNRNLLAAAICGFDQEGMRDGSIYGGGISNGSDPQQVHADPRWIATKRRYDTSSIVAPGNVFPFVDTLPPGDPHNCRALGASSFGSTDRAVIAERYQKYAQQVIDQRGIGYLSFHNEGEGTEILAALDTFCAWLYSQQLLGKVLVTTPLRTRRAFAAKLGN